LVTGCESTTASNDGAAAPIEDPYPSAVVHFKAGDTGGFGEDGLPDVVLGGPEGGGDSKGSLDVVSLGKGGEIVLRFDKNQIVDGPGVDFIVFENAFLGWQETGEVAVSGDGVSWHAFACDASKPASVGGGKGCAGLAPVYASSDNGIDPTDLAKAGGDRFDLATIGVKSAQFVRVRDTGVNDYGGKTGGFDLDAVAVVNGSAL